MEKNPYQNNSGNPIKAPKSATDPKATVKKGNDLRVGK